MYRINVIRVLYLICMKSKSSAYKVSEPISFIIKLACFPFQLQMKSKIDRIVLIFGYLKLRKRALLVDRYKNFVS